MQNPNPEIQLAWIKTQLGLNATEVHFDALAGDASLRRYYRVRANGRSCIFADASAEPGVTQTFAHCAKIFSDAGARVPHLLAWDNELGYSLQEDVGDRQLLPLLTDQSVDTYYRSAMQMLSQVARATTRAIGLPVYNARRLRTELDVCEEWFIRGLLGMEPSAEFQKAQGDLDERLIDSALAQAQVLVHRDFHSRNLMVTDTELVAIDFQDAVIGPVTYDLVSLLKDCYCAWPRVKVEAWVETFYDGLGDSLKPATVGEFLRDFDLMGLQRHIKVLGVFARLYLRDGKPGYLPDLPRVIAYIEETLMRYRESEPSVAEFFGRWTEQIRPAFEHCVWYTSCE